MSSDRGHGLFFSLCFIFILILVSTINVCGVDDCRQTYDFDEDVFNGLPKLPCDFYSIKTLYEQGKIEARHLGPDYLQPELIPTWNYWANRVYSSNSDRIGVYGGSFYPHNINIGNVTQGDSFTFSFLLRADWGIRYYQGVGIQLPNISGLNITLLGDSDILLSPTYPVFVEGWLVPITIEVKVLETGYYDFKILETHPCSEMSSLWKSMYGGDYVELGSLVTSSYHIRFDPPEANPSQYAADMNMGIVGLGIMLLIVLGTFYGLYRMLRHEERYDWEEE